jgi:hypothetical protein
VKARVLDRNGNYSRIPRRRGQPAFSAQEFLMAVAEGNAGIATIPEPVMPAAKAVRSRKTKSTSARLVATKKV